VAALLVAMLLNLQLRAFIGRHSSPLPYGN